MRFFDPPPLRYFGSKWKAAKWIIGQMPIHLTYVEPYCGGAAVFFRKEPARVEVLNDISEEIINFFDVLRQRCDELVKLLAVTPYSRREYERAFEPTDDPLERARRFYVRSRQGFISGEIHATGWRTQLNFRRGTSVVAEWARVEGLQLGAERLRAAMIECRPALDIIRDYDSRNTLFYVDPPYVLKARARKAKRYVFEMTDAEHVELAAVLRTVKGAVMLSGYDNPLYDDLYGDWYSSRKQVTTSGNSTAIETLWLNQRVADLELLPMYAQGDAE